MSKKEDDFKTTIMKALELKKQELLQSLDRLMKRRSEGVTCVAVFAE